MAKKNDKETFFSGWTAAFLLMLGVGLICFLAQMGMDYFSSGNSSSNATFFGGNSAPSGEVPDEDEDIKKAKQMKAAENSNAENPSDATDKNNSDKDNSDKNNSNKNNSDKNNSNKNNSDSEEKLSIQDKIAISNQKTQEANNFIVQGNYNKALEFFDQAIQIYSLNAAAYTGRGRIYFAIQNYDKAISDFNKAIEVDSTYADAYNNRAVYYQALGDTEAASADFAMFEILRRRQ